MIQTNLFQWYPKLLIIIHMIECIVKPLPWSDLEHLAMRILHNEMRKLGLESLLMD